MIEKIIKYIKEEFTIGYWIMIGYSIFLFLFIFISNFNLLLMDKFSIEYKTYNNVNVEVSDKEINGRLNKYIATKNISNRCYNLMCGFPYKGEFNLSEIKFIKIEKKSFLLSACINQQRCFYNITEKFTDEVKNNLKDKAKNEFKWAVLIIPITIILCFIESIPRRIRKKQGMLDM